MSSSAAEMKGSVAAEMQDQAKVRRLLEILTYALVLVEAADSEQGTRNYHAALPRLAVQ